VPVALWAEAFLDATSNQADVMIFFFAVGPIGLIAAIWGSSLVVLGGILLVVSAPTRRSPWAVIGAGVIVLGAAWTLAWGVRVAQLIL
jgi:hypothetical protein